MPTREELLQGLEANRTALGEVLASLQEADLSRPVYQGGWKVKELLCHFAALSYQGLPQRFLSPQAPPAPAMDIDAMNRQAVEGRMGRSLAELREEIEANTPKIVAMLRGLTEAQLATPVSLSWMQGTLADVLQAIVIGHERAHLADLQAALRPQ